MIDLVFDGHGFGIDGLLAGYAFESGEDAAVVILIALLPTSRKGGEKWGTRPSAISHLRLAAMRCLGTVARALLLLRVREFFTAS
jgi:hypothetical protein